MLHGVDIGIGCWLSLGGVGALCLRICLRRGAVVLAWGRLRGLVHPEVGRVVLGPQSRVES